MTRARKTTVRSRSRRAARLVAALAIGIGVLSAIGEPAHAADRGDCEWLFGVGSVPDVDLVKVDTGQVGNVDFGDGGHWWGLPAESAAVCWARNGDVAMFGRLYVDRSEGGTSWDVEVHALAEITYFQGNGQGRTLQYRTTDNTGDSVSVSAQLRYADFDKVRIRLYRINGNGSTEWLRTVWQYRNAS